MAAKLSCHINMRRASPQVRKQLPGPSDEPAKAGVDRRPVGQSPAGTRWRKVKNPTKAGETPRVSSRLDWMETLNRQVSSRPNGCMLIQSGRGESKRSTVEPASLEGGKVRRASTCTRSKTRVPGTDSPPDQSSEVGALACWMCLLSTFSTVRGTTSEHRAKNLWNLWPLSKLAERRNPIGRQDEVNELHRGVRWDLVRATHPREVRRGN